MSEASRKNGWQVAEEVGETNPYAIQHVLDRAEWDCDGVRDELRAYILERLSASNAVVVIDETGFLKKGIKSVGVQRQYSGTAGRIEKCQIGVFLAYANSRGHALTRPSNGLYRRAGPMSRNEASKPMCQEKEHSLRSQSWRSVCWNELWLLVSRYAWVTGDTVYGSSQSLRVALQEHRQPYALAVTRHQSR